jgi:DNA-binding GntR family transcriptional regulator
MTTIASRIQQSLAEQIIKGVLAPGHKLDEKALAEQFSVSRTPIREALKELAARGLVDFLPRRGGIVARIGIERLADMLEAECELEAHCARLASQRMTGLDRGQLQELFDRSTERARAGDREAYLELNQEFHELICSGVHNETIGATVRDLRDRLAPFRRTQPAELEDRLLRSHGEHEAIVRAIIGGDPEAAYTAMRNHNARLSSGVLLLVKQQASEGAVQEAAESTRPRKAADAARGNSVTATRSEQA